MWLRLTTLVMLLIALTMGKDTVWHKPGCHKVGHTRKISIPGCVEFMLTTNACRGFCESYAVPSAWGTVVMKPTKPVTSIGQCCNIMGSQNVVREVLCLDGYRNVTFKSATDCSCYHCKKD
ncbi:uncharacterized protein DMENIID0001_121520 [Sergentomyia squamirostris]